MVKHRPDFNFNLPQDLIARKAKQRREQAKMLCYNTSNLKLEDKKVSDVLDYLNKGDVLVLNDVKVRKARFHWQYKSKIEELVFLKCLETDDVSSVWEVILSGKKTKLDTPYQQGSFKFLICEKLKHGLVNIRVNMSQKELYSLMQLEGKLPIPPYIRKMRKVYGEEQDFNEDQADYQTQYAKEEGAVAAPTAGLHFSSQLLNKIKAKGIQVVYLRLDVGWGTFEPLTEEHWKTDTLHEERVYIQQDNAQQLHQAMQDEKRILAVGTTSIRALEWWYRQGMPIKTISGMCDVFLYHPWKSPVATAMLTNFHFPQTSLLHLVSAFIADEAQTELLRIYEHAIAQRYMFYSYGDCMLIDRGIQDVF